MRHALVFGGTGQIGEPLVARLRTDGWRVTAVSRSAQRDEPGLTWLEGEFDAMPALPPQMALPDDVLRRLGLAKTS